MAEGLPLTMEELRELVHEECRLAVRQEIEAVLIRALSTPEPEGPEPASWSMSLPQLVLTIAHAVDAEFVRETLVYERQHPDGARSGVIAACEVRLAELEG